MKTKLIAAAIAAALFSAPAWAQMGPGMMGGYGGGGYGMGSGMMGGYGAGGGYGMGPGMMGGYGPGGGYGMGPGMMGGYGMGPGMMGGYGMGPGMMGGYGMGPGMMGGFGMGPGMMGGYSPQGPGARGPWMMGPGMHGGYGAYAGINLSDEQRAKIAEIQQDVSRKHWDLMGKMHEQRYRLYEYDSSGKLDENAARKAFQAMTDAHKAIFETNLDARKRIEAVLTKEQLEQLRRNWRGG